MYEDAWYNSLVPSYAEDKPKASKHRRRESLLKQPNVRSPLRPASRSINDMQEKDPIEASQAGIILEGNEEAHPSNEPPRATIARRAKSYSDFYTVAQNQLDRDWAARTQRRPSTVLDRLEALINFDSSYVRQEEELLYATDHNYELYLNELTLSKAHLDSLLSSASSTLELLSSLTESFKSVDAQTTTVQEQCEGVVSEQRRISRLVDGIDHNLQYYNYLEPITRRLNATGAGNFVRGSEFSETLSHLDNCLEYMQAHPDHRESLSYRSRYRLLLTRALTLIRNHFVSSLREIVTDVSKRIADRQLNDTTMSALLYAKFRVGSAELKDIGQEIQKRAVLPEGADPDAEPEYQSLMNELHQNYSAARGRLILPLIRKKMNEIAIAPSTAKDLVAFARSSVGYVRGMCLDEYELWHEWFEGDEGLYDFLETICEPLYDHLRPRIIRENNLPKLCELCTLIQTQYMKDGEDDAEPMEIDQLDFSTLIHPALEDAQTRLVFRTQAILRDEIENYKPKAADLEYPPSVRKGTLSGRKRSSQPATSGRKDSTTASSVQVISENKHTEQGETGDNKDPTWGIYMDPSSAGWYPTLKTAIWLLSRIYRLVNSTVFDDLAHQIVHQTTISLHRAASQISPKPTSFDGQLFLIKYLLILKQQIVAFDIEFVTPDISFDFSGVTNTFWELRERGGLFNPSALMHFVGGGLLPRVVENMLDAKAELDGRLRTVINKFTTAFADRMTADLSRIKGSKSASDGDQAIGAVKNTTEKEVSVLRRKLDEYLDDVRTKETLVAAVCDQVLQTYEEFYEKFIMEVDDTASVQVNGKSKEKASDVWKPDTFAEWAANIFKVRGIALQDEEYGSSRSISPDVET